LKAAGATPRDIIHVRHYIVQDTGDAEADSVDVVDRGWAPLWIEFMDTEGGGHRPPDTVLGVASLAKKHLLYEVEVWAIVHG
jgi:enamine deaminase RidA (YjgF/YER057c/UK114 family)